MSWSHYRLLMRVEDEDVRAFYADEAVKSGWSVRQLQRQINTMFYHRILASKDKESVAAEIQTTVPKPEYEKIIKDPYVLEFLDLPQNEHFYESELEQALIDHLQKLSAILCRRITHRFMQRSICRTCLQKKSSSVNLNLINSRSWIWRMSRHQKQCTQNDKRGEAYVPFNYPHTF